MDSPGDGSRTSSGGSVEGSPAASELITGHTASYAGSEGAPAEGTTTAADEAEEPDDVLEYDLFGATVKVEVKRVAEPEEGAEGEPGGDGGGAGTGSAGVGKGRRRMKQGAKSKPTSTTKGKATRGSPGRGGADSNGRGGSGGGGEDDGPKTSLRFTIRKAPRQAAPTTELQLDSPTDSLDAASIPSSSPSPSPKPHRRRRMKRTGSGLTSRSGRSSVSSSELGSTRRSRRSGRLTQRSTASSTASRRPGDPWVSPFHTKRTRSRLPPAETEGSRRITFKHRLADDGEGVLDDSLPGPAAYGAPKLPQPSGGRFNVGNSKNAVEWQIYLQSKVPGPKYFPKQSWDRGGTFSTATPLSALEWQIYRARGLPSPAQYPAPKLRGPSGGRFSTAKPKSDVEWKIYRASQIPGPGQYEPDDTSLSTRHRAPHVAFQSKPIRGNYQTHLTDAISFIQTTINPHGPNACNYRSSFASQVDSMKPTKPIYSFAPRREQEAREKLRQLRLQKKREAKRAARRRRKAAKAGKDGAPTGETGGSVAPAEDGTPVADGLEEGARSASPTAGEFVGGREEGDEYVLAGDEAAPPVPTDGMDPFYKYFGYVPGGDNSNLRRPVFKSTYARSRTIMEQHAMLSRASSAPNVSGRRRKGSRASTASRRSRRSGGASTMDSKVSLAAEELELLADAKRHVRPMMSDADLTVPGPGTYNMDRCRSVGKQALSRTVNSPQMAIGLAHRKAQWKVAFVPDVKVV